MLDSGPLTPWNVCVGSTLKPHLDDWCPTAAARLATVVDPCLGHRGVLEWAATPLPVLFFDWLLGHDPKETDSIVWIVLGQRALSGL